MVVASDKCSCGIRMTQEDFLSNLNFTSISMIFDSLKLTSYLSTRIVGGNLEFFISMHCDEIASSYVLSTSSPTFVEAGQGSVCCPSPRTGFAIPCSTSASRCNNNCDCNFEILFHSMCSTKRLFILDVLINFNESIRTSPS